MLAGDTGKDTTNPPKLRRRGCYCSASSSNRNGLNDCADCNRLELATLVVNCEPTGANMPHAKSLRAIGQSLEVGQVADFEVENAGEYYLVLSNSLTHRLVRFSPADISRLDARARRQRCSDSFSRTPVAKRLSQRLRTLGDHLDRAEARAFRLSWTSHSVCVNYERRDGQNGSRMFSAKELQQIGSQSRRRRTSATRFDSSSPNVTL